MSRARLEAFSDGVIAVAITLLALDLAVPGPGHGSLLTQLGERWPEFLAYLISFLTIGIIWVNHHAVINNVARVDRKLLFLNLLLLVFVVAIPFATTTMAEYLTRGGNDARVSMVLYAGVFLGMGFAFAFIFEWTRKPGRVHHPVPPELQNQLRIRQSIGSLVYIGSLVVAFFNQLAALLIIAAVAVYYVFEPAPRQLRQRHTHAADEPGGEHASE